jgi:CheY-like chemotaxis protein
MLLVIAEGDAFANRVTESLGRKFGVAALDYVQGLVKPTLAGLGGGDWGPVRLVLVHQRLRVSSGLELTHQMVANEGCTLPILVAGVEDDVALKRNRAIAAGAVDFISVEPFHVLKVMRAIEDTLRMFG